jgi:hypothetical protein
MTIVVLYMYYKTPASNKVDSLLNWITVERCLYLNIGLVWFMVFNATFKYISVISWRSVLLVEEAGVRRENHRSVASHWQTLSHNVVHLVLIEIRTHNISGDRHRLHTCRYIFVVVFIRSPHLSKHI